MPITVHRGGDLLESDAQALVNTVNCVGVMGKGIAAQFKKRFPEMFEDYLARCEAGEVRPGEPYLYQATLMPPWVVNFPTKQHWRGRSRFEWVRQGVERLEHQLPEWGVESIAVPPLGCGHGGLDWREVGPFLTETFERWAVRVELYAPLTER